MGWSDKKLVNEARKRYERLKKNGLDTDTLKILENNLKVFYKQNPKIRKTSLSGISLKKSMTTAQRKEMRQIIRSFLKGDESKAKQIERNYYKLFGDYQRSMHKKKKMEKPKNLRVMMGEVKKLKRILEDRKALSYLGSEVLKDVWDSQKENGWNVNIVRRVLNEYVNEVEEFEKELEKQGVSLSRNSNEDFMIIVDRIERRMEND